MTMKKTTLLFLFICALSSAQVQRFIYEYKFIPDSTNRENVIKEMMLLNIEKKGSHYYSLDKFQQDSINRADLEKQINSGSNSLNIQRREKKGFIGDKVSKEYPDFKVFLSTSLGQDKYRVLEDQKPEWKIFPDQQKFGNYQGQKAITNFGGRQWTAWFSTDLPFQDGPYKFYGLPGLIIKITDASGDFDMTLIGNKTIDKEAENEEVTSGTTGGKRFNFGGKEIEITEKQFKKVWRDYLADPTKNMRQMMGSSTGADGSTVTKVIKMRDASGKELDQNQMFKTMEKVIKEREAKNNNKIEPTLYK